MHQIHPRFSKAIKKLLHYSWKDIDFDYDSLYDEEQECITREEFEVLAKWVQS